MSLFYGHEIHAPTLFPETTWLDEYGYNGTRYYIGIISFKSIDGIMYFENDKVVLEKGWISFLDYVKRPWKSLKIPISH